MDPRKKRIFLEILAFNATLGLVLWALNSWVDSRIDSHYELFYREVLRPENPAPIVILGTSQSEVAINPAALEKRGLNAVNFSTDNSDPYYYEKWWKEIFEKHYPQPKTIVYCVNWVTFANKGRQFEHDSQYFPTGYFIQKLFDGTLNRETLLSNRFALFKYRLFIFKLLRDNYSYYPWLMDHVYKGYVPVDGQGELKTVLVDKISEINPAYLDCFLRLLDRWNAQGINVIFVQVPEYIPGRESPNLERNMALLHQIAKERGIPYLDYNGELKSALNDAKEYYRDWTHLNKAGSEVFGARFAEDLKEVMEKKGWL